MDIKLYKNKPIPELRKKDGWEMIPIKDNGEILVNIGDFSHPKIRIEPVYFKQGLSGSFNACYAREQVAERLMKASNNLPKGYRFVIYDAWRPLKIQKEIFNGQMSLIREESLFLSEQEIFKKTNRFVALPELREKSPATHATGGAIDLTIEDPSGKLLFMGSGFDEFSDVSNTYYLENKERSERLTSLEKEARNNRRLLFHIMAEQGFTNFTEEWWHFDYNNQYWAVILGKDKAFYGLIDLK